MTMRSLFSTFLLTTAIVSAPMSHPQGKENGSPLPWDHASDAGVVRTAGFVPDAETAIKIAEAVLIPVYGKSQIIGERPFSASLRQGIWHVRGYLPPDVAGGVAEVDIAKKDARIIRMIHGR